MVYKQKGSKNWWFKFNWNGKPIRESTKQTNKAVARQMEAARKTQLAKGEVGIRSRAPKPTVAAFADEKFLPHVRVEKASKPLTVAFYQRCVNNLKNDPTLNALPLDEIKAEHITKFVNSRRREGMKTPTINRDLATLRRMLNLAEEWDVVTAALRVKLLPGEEGRNRVLSEREEQAYLATCPPLLQALYTIMLDCGFRPEECHRLRWSENIQRDAIEIHKGKGSGSPRRIEVTERVSKVLDALEKSKTSDFVFPAPTKAGHINTSTYVKLHRKAPKDSGVKYFVPYVCRHTCITRWAQAGMDVFTLKYYAGHKDIKTTLKYVHLAGTDAQEKLREIRERMRQKSEGRGGHSLGHSAKPAA